MSGTTRRPAPSAAACPLNRAGLASAIAELADLPATKAVRALDAAITAIESALRQGREVRLPGFGSFTVTRRKGDDRAASAHGAGGSRSVRPARCGSSLARR